MGTILHVQYVLQVKPVRIDVTMHATIRPLILIIPWDACELSVVLFPYLLHLSSDLNASRSSKICTRYLCWTENWCPRPASAANELRIQKSVHFQELVLWTEFKHVCQQHNVLSWSLHLLAASKVLVRRSTQIDYIVAVVKCARESINCVWKAGHYLRCGSSQQKYCCVLGNNLRYLVHLVLPMNFGDSGQSIFVNLT